MSQSTGSARSRKPSRLLEKPYPDFPLSPHPGGKWQKKIRGKIHYFGRWSRLVNGKLERVPGDGWEEALKLYKDQADDLHAGRKPRDKCDGLNVADLCNHFLTSKGRKRDAGELGGRMFDDYKRATDLIVKTFGITRRVDDLRPEDFGQLRAKLAKKWGPTRLGNAITRIKGLFKFGFENGLLDKPVRYGSEFSKPDKSVLRRHRAAKPKKMLDPAELGRVIDAADPTLKAMILLGLNAGMGNNDCATLPRSALDLDR